MKIEFQYSRTTGIGKEAEAALRQAIEATGVSAEVAFVEIEGAEEARQRRFLGSPTIRIDGMDIEYGEREPEEYQAGTRYYNTPDGWMPYPHAKLIANAILEAIHRQERQPR